MPSSYREPTGTPLLWFTDYTVLALEPATGALLWKHDSENEVTRLFIVGDRVFVVGWGVDCLDLMSGRLIGAVPLEFRVTAGLADRERLYLAGADGAAAVGRDGQLLWRAARKFGEGLLNFDQVVEGTTGGGSEPWRVTVKGSPQDYPGLAHGDQVAQRDLKGER